jgi:Holliday junction resolvase RusA-like endonuclease
MRYKSDAYKQWENKSKLVCKKGLTISDPIRAEYIFFVPDKRTRDIENYSKCVSDFLVNQRVIEDDGHHIIKALDLRFGGFDKGNPRVEISIYPVGAA